MWHYDQMAWFKVNRVHNLPVCPNGSKPESQSSSPCATSISMVSKGDVSSCFLLTTKRREAGGRASLLHWKRRPSLFTIWLGGQQLFGIAPVLLGDILHSSEGEITILTA